jgi:C4-type Zn-finger protein
MKSNPKDRMAFGANDRISCPKCEGEMIVVRRILNPNNRNFELQILECDSCSNQERRTIDIRAELLG